MIFTIKMHWNWFYYENALKMIFTIKMHWNWILLWKSIGNALYKFERCVWPVFNIWIMYSRASPNIFRGYLRVMIIDLKMLSFLPSYTCNFHYFILCGHWLVPNYSISKVVKHSVTRQICTYQNIAKLLIHSNIWFCQLHLYRLQRELLPKK